MVNHGLSHGMAALVCTLSSEMLMEVFRTQTPLFYQRLYLLVSSLTQQINWSQSTEFSINLLLILVLGFMWGVAFKVLNQ